LLLGVKLNHCQLLLEDSSVWIESHEADSEVVLTVQGSNWMVCTNTDISLLELVDNSPCDTVNKLDGDSAAVFLVGCDQSENIAVKELVEKLSFLAEDGWEDMALTAGGRD